MFPEKVRYSPRIGQFSFSKAGLVQVRTSDQKMQNSNHRNLHRMAEVIVAGSIYEHSN